MENKLAVIGIDSLDPYVVLKYGKELPNFSKLIEESSTFISKSVFPVDTIPAWASIYTGLHPGTHGLLYVYDVFDPNLSDLGKLDISRIKGRTFWDYAGQEGYRTAVVYPMLMYPSWEVNGVMVSKSPFDRRIDWIRTEIDIDVYPKFVKEKYKIPDKFMGLWGGYPGVKRLKEWAELGKEILEKEKTVGMGIYKNENWDLFFIYFSLLDIIQHRLWRFFDEGDTTHYENHLSKVILEYYKIFDEIVGEFMEVYPDVSLVVMSDHGHRSRPIKTININEYLRKKGYLVSKGKNKKAISKIRKTILEVANRLNIEHWLIKLVVKSQKLTKVSKSMYSSAGYIDRSKSIAYLSNFAGIKSYPHGGIEINKDLLSDTEYEKVREELIESLSGIKTPNGEPLMKWIKRIEELYLGRFTEEIYPDIVFELKEDYGVGWELYSNLFGKAYDHKVASGGHARNAVFLLKNVSKQTYKTEMTLMDIAPTILDLLDISIKDDFEFDGQSIF
jgi:predicted AlkP superfamily phosphohydrolase/phosphomutase